MKATIITIGDEILIGQIVDTNSVSIARHLNAAGIVVHEKVSIGDDSAQIVGCVERALGQSDIAIITGGLGPTKDDITKKTLAEMFGSELIPNQTVSDHVKRMLEERGIEFNDLNRGQALVPACCTVLFNAHGTAHKLETSAIYWIENCGHDLVFHTAEGEVTAPGSMTETEEKLAQDSYFRVNKGCLVNLEHVDRMDGEDAVVHGDRVPLARARRKAFLDALNDYINGTG